LTSKHSSSNRWTPELQRQTLIVFLKNNKERKVGAASIRIDSQMQQHSSIMMMVGVFNSVVWLIRGSWFPWSEASFSTDNKRQIAAIAQDQELSANCESQPFSCWLDR
jgi:hypothetical protein